MKTFVLDGDDFEEANEESDTGYSRGSQWKLRPGFVQPLWNSKVAFVQLWMAAVLLTGLNPPSLAWSFPMGIARVSKTSLQTSTSKLNWAARTWVYWRMSLSVFIHYVRILVQLPCWSVTRHFGKLMFHGGIGGCTLISLLHYWHHKSKQCT